MPTEMQAAVLRKIGEPMEVETVTLDDPAPDEVRIRVVGSGLCHSDLHLINGSMPASLPVIAGHEVGGIVLEVGSEVTGLSKGDHVISCISTHCNKCSRCTSGRTWLCENRLFPGIRSASQPKIYSEGTPIGGIGGSSGFAEQMIMHQSAFVAIDPSMPLDRAALIGCAVVTGVGAVTNAARVQPNETCAVIGCGGIGLNIVQGAKLAGSSRIIAIDRQKTKLELALKFGATDAIDVNQGDPVEAVLSLTNNQGIDHVFEAIGLKTTAEQALKMTAVGGTGYLVGAMPADVNFEIPGLEFVISDKTFRGVRMGSSNIETDFPRFVELYQQGRLLLDELIAERITLSQINDGYENMRNGEQARSVIVFDRS